MSAVEYRDDRGWVSARAGAACDDHDPLRRLSVLDAPCGVLAEAFLAGVDYGRRLAAGDGPVSRARHAQGGGR